MSAIALDPLVAEAKRRARRRRLLALGAALVVAGAAAAVWSELPSGRPGTTGSSSLGTSLAARLETAASDRINVSLTGDAGGGVRFAQGSGKDGLWLTADGGRTWLQGPAGVFWTPDDIDFVNHRYGWIAQDPWVYRTTDGGRSWTRANTPSRRLPGTRIRLHDEFSSLAFVSRKVGFASGLPAYPNGEARYRLFVTHDGGVTWQARGALPAGAGYASFVNTRTGFAPTGNSVAYTTTDGGRTWSVLHPAPPCAGTPAGGRYGGKFQLWQCGRSLDVTTDGGSSWTVRHAPAGLTSVSSVTPRTWVGQSLVGQAPSRLFVTTSAGRAWTVHRFAAPPHWTIPLLGFTSPRAGWAIFGREPPGGHASLLGPERGHLFRALVLMRTTDGGRQWTPAGPLKPHRR